jgi:hypothetical protein
MDKSTPALSEKVSRIQMDRNRYRTLLPRVRRQIAWERTPFSKAIHGIQGKEDPTFEASFVGKWGRGLRALPQKATRRSKAVGFSPIIRRIDPAVQHAQDK